MLEHVDATVEDKKSQLDERFRQQRTSDYVQSQIVQHRPTSQPSPAPPIQPPNRANSQDGYRSATEFQPDSNKPIKTMHEKRHARSPTSPNMSPASTPLPSDPLAQYLA